MLHSQPCKQHPGVIATPKTLFGLALVAMVSAAITH